MQMRTLTATSDGWQPATADDNAAVARAGDEPVSGTWIDVLANRDDIAAVIALTDRFGLDRLAVRDALVDVDLPKVDDFGDSLLVVLHGLRDDQVGTYEVHCFLTGDRLVTIHDRESPAIDAVWEQQRRTGHIEAPQAGVLLGLVADTLTRRLMEVLNAFDDRVESLIARALAADPALLEDLSAIRSDVTRIRRVVHPQREALDVLRHSTSPLLDDVSRRKFSDVFDVAGRAAAGFDEARSALAETLDAYRGAEARVATEVTKVLTVYAAIMLPLSLIAGFFGMNFAELPWMRRSWGWWVAAGVMLLVAVVSLGMFISLGWVRRPSGRSAGRTLGAGLIEATRTPVQVMSAVLEFTAMPIRATGDLINRPSPADARDDPQYGSE